MDDTVLRQRFHRYDMRCGSGLPWAPRSSTDAMPTVALKGGRLYQMGRRRVRGGVRPGDRAMHAQMLSTRCIDQRGGAKEPGAYVLPRGSWEIPHPYCVCVVTCEVRTTVQAVHCHDMCSGAFRWRTPLSTPSRTRSAGCPVAPASMTGVKHTCHTGLASAIQVKCTPSKRRQGFQG
jgi:hypothetical protein